MNPSIIGAVRDSYDPRNYQFAPRGAFDWETGFDIEKVIGTKLTIKDQNGSGSCGGQAWSYYGEVLEAIATETYEPRSARYLYSAVRAPSGGSMGKPLSDFVCKNGFALEVDAPSYDNGKPPSEMFMSKVPVLSETQLDTARTSKALSYVQVKADIDVLAQALQDNNGVCVALYGEDNGTWRSEFPQPPVDQDWAHWLYVGKAKMIDGKKHLGVINSWGKKAGKNGWQWISEDYFVNGNVWYGWTLAWDYTPARNKVLMQKMIKALTQLVELLRLKAKK